MIQEDAGASSTWLDRLSHASRGAAPSIVAFVEPTSAAGDPEHEKRGTQAMQDLGDFSPGGAVPLRSCSPCSKKPDKPDPAGNAIRNQSKPYDHSTSCHRGAVADTFFKSWTRKFAELLADISSEHSTKRI